MKEIIQEYCNFLSKLNQIKTYINNTYRRDNGIIAIIEDYAGENIDLLNYYKSIIDSSLQYNAIVINLYGAYENFISKISKSYLIVLFNNAKSIEDLPKKLVKKYQSNVGNYLNNNSKFSNYDIKVNQVISNYNDFLNSNFSNINYELLLNHSGNLNYEHLKDYLKEIGILGDKSICESSLLKNFYIDNGLYDEMEFNEKKNRVPSDLFNPLNNLVNTRNTVAHTGEEENRISVNEFDNLIIPFLNIISRIITEMIIDRINYYKKENSKFDIIKIYNDKILCINNNSQNIKIGDMVIYRKNNVIHTAIIKKIEIYHNSVEETGTEPIDVGCELDSKINNDCQIIDICNMADLS